MDKNNSSIRKGLRLNIGNRIFGGFLLLILLFIINAAVIFVAGNQFVKVVKNSSEVIRPSEAAINEFMLLVTRAKMLTTNWVYLQTNDEDKQALRDLQNFEYPALKEKTQKLGSMWDNKRQVDLLDSVFVKFEEMIEVQKDIMQKLQNFDDYDDFMIKGEAEIIIESVVIPESATIIEMLKRITEMQSVLTAKSDESLITSTARVNQITILLGSIIVIIGILSALFMSRSITRPINYLKEVVVKLGKGELVEDQNRKFNNDEIGEMAEAMDKFVNGLKSTTLFAENIGNGNYNVEFKPLSESDVLGNALLDMRGNLARVAEEDKKRNWTTEGIALFGEILRRNNDDVSKLSDEIIATLVKYLGANQGGLYLIDDIDDDEPYMTLASCYAWNKKKFIDQKIYKGEGLAGQCWQEGDIIYITDVPQNYIRITSGLGDANPTAILIVPLKVNDQIFGVVELASFKEFADHEKDFVIKISESIASTISSVKINARTQTLLEESQQMTEEMRAQEEEMRQNMEEMQATQEELARKNAEMEEIANREKRKAQEAVDAQKKQLETKTEQFSKLEAQYKSKIEELEKKLKTAKV